MIGALVNWCSISTLNSLDLITGGTLLSSGLSRHVTGWRTFVWVRKLSPTCVPNCPLHYIGTIHLCIRQFQWKRELP